MKPLKRMKKVVFVLIAVWMCIAASRAENPETPVKNEPIKRFSYSVYGEIPVVRSTFEEPHFLGGALNKKWNTFLQNYTRTYDVSVGLSGSTVEVAKPAIYNAVLKANKYYRKAVRRGEIKKEEAVKSLSHILDCANVICTETETEQFEKAVSDAKDPKEIITLFGSIELTFM